MIRALVLLAVLLLAGCSSPQAIEPPVMAEGRQAAQFNVVTASADDEPTAWGQYSGDGGQGDVVRTAQGPESAVVYEDALVQAASYTLPEGATLTTHGHAIYIFATNRITIAGHVDLRGRGALGGAPSASGEEGYGQAGGPGNENGGGGSGVYGPEVGFAFLSDPIRFPNAYGSGGGGGGPDCSDTRASAGGGGAGTPTRAGGRGGDAGEVVGGPHAPGRGGAGGGSLYLHAPTIEILASAVIDVGGEDGQSGTGNCGAGGGGSGGLVHLTYRTLVLEGQVYVDGGRGGPSARAPGATGDSPYAGRAAPPGGGEGGAGADGYFFGVQV